MKDLADVRGVLPWRLVAGGFLHFVMPAYLVAVLVDAALFAPPASSLESILRRAIPFSGKFLLAYALVALAASLAAAILDPPLRARRAWRAMRDPEAPAMLSEKRLLEAVRQGGGQFDAEADRMLASLRQGRWNHRDPRFQALSRDLAELVRTSAVALASAERDRRAAIAQTASDGLRGIAAGLRDLEMEASRLDEGDAQAVAHYVKHRYGADFAGGGN